MTETNILIQGKYYPKMFLRTHHSLTGVAGWLKPYPLYQKVAVLIPGQGT